MANEGAPEAVVGAQDEELLLQVPACVQQFSTQWRLFPRLRALARRRRRGPLEAAPAVGPVTLQVEENPHWSAIGGPGDEPEIALCESLSEASAALAPDLPEDLAAAIEDALPAGAAAAGGADATVALIRQLEEDNRDLKGALCQLIRISEQSHAALRLLEEENENLAALVQRLNAQAAAARGEGKPGAVSRAPRWLPTWAVAGLRQLQERRCL